MLNTNRTTKWIRFVKNAERNEFTIELLAGFFGGVKLEKVHPISVEVEGET